MGFVQRPGLDDLKAPFQPPRFYDSMTLHRGLRNPRQTKPVKSHVLVTIAPRPVTLHHSGWCITTLRSNQGWGVETAQNNGGCLKPGSKRATAEHRPYAGKINVGVSPPGWHVSPSPSLEPKEVTLPRCRWELSAQGGE